MGFYRIMNTTINNSSEVLYLSYGNRIFKILPKQIVDVSIKTDRYFVVHTSDQNHVIDVQDGCNFIQGVTDIETTSALEIYELWQYQ